MTSACQPSSKKAQSSYENENLKLVSSLHFNLGEDKILDPNIIDQNVAWLQANPGHVLILEGHCDERGGEDYNLELGDRRARAVMKAMMDRGISEDRLIIISYGEDKPYNESQNEEAWSMNRRVVFIRR